MFDIPSKGIQVACSLWNEGRRADALVLFTEAIRQEPNNVRTYVMAARAKAEMFDFDGMEQTHEKLVQRAPRNPGVHHCIGENFGLIRLPERAITSYERAAELPGVGAPTWLELAALYERTHRLDEAEELIDRIMQAGFELPMVSLLRGRIQRRQNQPEQAKATFRSLIARIPEDSELACQAWSELALMKDAEGDFEGASDAIERCKRVQKSHESVFWKGSEKAHAQMQDLITAITSEDVRSWRDTMQYLPTQRVALLTGFPRSGTTLLEHVLDAHPDLVSSEERDFIGRETLHSVTVQRRTMPLINVLNDLTVDEIRSERQRYFSAMEYLLGESIRGRMHLDKNPAYNLTIPLALRVFPETRLIIALRDPRDVVLSCYMRYLPLNAVSVRFLDIERTAERYALDMKAWLKFRDFIDVPWCAVRYEDIVANFEPQARRVLATLGLPWDEQVLKYRQRPTTQRQVISPSYEAVAQPIYTRAVGRWKNYERLLEPALSKLDPFIREFGYSG